MQLKISPDSLLLERGCVLRVSIVRTRSREVSERVDVATECVGGLEKESAFLGEDTEFFHPNA